MKKKLVSFVAVGSLLLLSACSSNSAAEPTVTQTETSAAVETSASPTPTAEAPKKMTSKDFNKIDVKFDLSGVTEDKPYGVNYSFLTAPSQLQYFTTYKTKDIEKAAHVGLETYYNIRTNPQLFKNSRTVESDDKVIKKYSKNIGKYVLDDWNKEKKNGDLFSYVPLNPVLNMGLYSYEGGESIKDLEKHLNTYHSYYVDTRETQKLQFLDAVASESTLDSNLKRSVQLNFIEEAEYVLEDNGVGTITTDVELFIQEDSKGVWQVQGMFWTSPEQTMVDDNGKALPTLKKNKK